MTDAGRNFGEVQRPMVIMVIRDAAASQMRGTLS